MAIKHDNELNLPVLKNLLTRIENNIHSSGNHERHAMNGFIIALGTYIEPLTREASASALRIGTITVDMNGTACKVPNAFDYIQKVAVKGLI